MPALMARAHEKGGACNHIADCTSIDKRAAALVSTAQESIGRTADTQVALCRQIDQAAGFFHGQAQGLLGMHVFARRQGLHPHLDMCGRNGEVDDDLHGVVTQQGVH